MKIKILFTMIALLTLVGKAHADNLSVSSVTMKPGETKLLEISLINPDRQYTAFQFDLQLPEGISIAKNDKGKFVASLDDERKDDHSFAVSAQEGNTYRFLAYSMSNAVFTGTGGVLVNISISSDQALEEGVKVANLKAQVFTDAAGNQYNLDNLSFNITIATPQVPMITADNKSREYGEENPAFTYTTNAEITGVPQLTCEATKTSKVGTYDILVNRGTLEGDYTSTNGVLTVTKAPLTISGGTYTILQGDDIPTFEAKYAGFKNGETASVLTKVPTLTTLATSNSAPGTYDVIVSGAEAENYDITYQKGTLIIKESPSTEKLVVDDITMPADVTKQIAINLENPKRNFVAFQFDMELPEGITLAKNEKNKFIVSLNEERTDDHSISVSVIGSNTYRFLAYSMSNAQISGNSGTLLNMSICSDANIGDGIKTATLKNLVFTDTNGQQFNLDETTFNIIIVTPVITADDKSRVYGDANPELTFTTTSELIGSPELSTSAIATSPVGNYDIVVNRGTVEGRYTGVNGKLIITKANLTISAKNYTIKQGEDLPIFEAEYDGFKNNETEAVLITKPKLSTQANSTSSPGMYEITVSNAEAQNYEISYVKGTLTITEADPVIVTAKSYTREYGEANPGFEYSATGATLVGVPEITCEATAKSPVGTYPIVISKGSVTNYNDTYVNGTLTIIKAPLTVSVENVTREQYLDNPSFFITYAGWKLGEDESVLIKKPIATTDATKESPVGTYEIIVSGGEATNYELIYQNGVLTVTESSGIVTISTTHPMNVYDTHGRLVRAKATTLKGLPKGIYIVNGQKVVIK